MPLTSWYRIAKRHRQAMANIEIAVGVLAPYVRGILGQSGTVTKIPIRTDIVQRMRVSVACDHAHSVIVARVERDLQPVVIGAINIAHLKNISEVWKLGG